MSQTSPTSPLRPLIVGFTAGTVAVLALAFTAAAVIAITAPTGLLGTHLHLGPLNLMRITPAGAGAAVTWGPLLPVLAILAGTINASTTHHLNRHR